jgi:hypothetical protein
VRHFLNAHWIFPMGFSQLFKRINLLALQIVETQKLVMGFVKVL